MKGLAWLLLLLASLVSSAQDIVITQQGDSIPCKISKVDRQYIYFVYRQGSVNKETLMPLEQVRSYEKSYFQNHNLEAEEIVIRKERNYPVVDISPYFGYGYRLGKISRDIPEEVRSYLRKTRNGVVMGARASYYFSENYGIGLVLSNYTSSHSSRVLMPGYTVRDDIRIRFLGPSFVYRQMSPGKESMQLIVSLGHLRYINNATYDQEVTFRGSTFGMNMSSSMEVFSGDHVSAGLRLTSTMGVLSAMNIYRQGNKQKVKLADDEQENLSMLELGAYIRFFR